MYNQLWNFLKYHISYNDISALASIATFVSALIALFTLRSMNKQNKNAHKPDLFLSPNNTLDQNILINNFNNTDPDSELYFEYSLTLDDITGRGFGIIHSIENVGLGTAKFVKIKWHFEKKTAIENIKKKLKSPYSLEVLNDSVLYLKTNKNQTILSFLLDIDDKYETKFDFLLPRKDEKFNLSPSIPEDFTNYLFFTTFLILNF